MESKSARRVIVIRVDTAASPPLPLPLPRYQVCDRKSPTPRRSIVSQYEVDVIAWHTDVANQSRASFTLLIGSNKTVDITGEWLKVFFIQVA